MDKNIVTDDEKRMYLMLHGWQLWEDVKPIEMWYEDHEVGHLLLNEAYHLARFRDGHTI